MKILIVSLFVLISAHCFGQGNPATNDFGSPPTTTGQDWSKALSDIGINVSVGNAGGLAFILYFGVKLLRTKTGLGNTPFGGFLSTWLNAESKQACPSGATLAVPPNTPPKTP